MVKGNYRHWAARFFIFHPIGRVIRSSPRTRRRRSDLGKPVHLRARLGQRRTATIASMKPEKPAISQDGTSDDDSDDEKPLTAMVKEAANSAPSAPVKVSSDTGQRDAIFYPRGRVIRSSPRSRRRRRFVLGKPVHLRAPLCQRPASKPKPATSKKSDFKINQNFGEKKQGEDVDVEDSDEDRDAEDSEDAEDLDDEPLSKKKPKSSSRNKVSSGTGQRDAIFHPRGRATRSSPCTPRRRRQFVLGNLFVCVSDRLQSRNPPRRKGARMRTRTRMLKIWRMLTVRTMSRCPPARRGPSHRRGTSRSPVVRVRRHGK